MGPETRREAHGNVVVLRDGSTEVFSHYTAT